MIHPANRAQRLAQKKHKFNDSQKEKGSSGKVRRKIKEDLKEQESRDELRDAGNYLL